MYAECSTKVSFHHLFNVSWPSIWDEVSVMATEITFPSAFFPGCVLQIKMRRAQSRKIQGKGTKNIPTKIAKVVAANGENYGILFLSIHSDSTDRNSPMNPSSRNNSKLLDPPTQQQQQQKSRKMRNLLKSTTRRSIKQRSYDRT